MAKTKISELDAAAANNTDINSVDVSEGCPPSGINNAIREMGAMLKRMDNGTDHLTNPNITGDLDVDNININGNSITSTDTNGDITLDPNGTGKVNITGGFTATDGCTITTADNTAQLTLTSTDADASAGPVLMLNRDSGSPADGDVIGTLRFNADDDAGNSTLFATIIGKVEDASNGSEDGELRIEMVKAGADVGRLNMTGAETVFNEDSKDIDFRVESDSNTHGLFLEGSTSHLLINNSSFSSNGTLVVQQTADSKGIAIVDSAAANTLFIENDGTINRIRNNASVPLTFETASTERLRITSGGSVLIGDSSTDVTSKLVVSGNGNADTATFMYDGSAGTYLDINTNAANGIISVEANARTGNFPPLTFITSGSERLRIQSGGGISFNGDTAAANALSDYEEGNASSLSVQTGTATFSKQRYIKIGKLVKVSFQVDGFSNRTGANNIVIQNLPFTSGSTAKTVGTALGRYVTAGDGPVVAMVGDSSSELILFGMNDGGNWDQIEHQQLNNDAATFVINITYETA